MKLVRIASLARFLSVMLAVVIVASGAVRAEEIFSFDATPGKLPKTVVPTQYAIELRPDAESLALPGVAVIDIDVREATARLMLNAVDIAIASVTADDSAERADVALDAAAEIVTFTFAKPLAAGAHRLRIEFAARINRFDRGFFFVDYPTDGGVKRLLTSKLEPADARRIFPCWDEPAFKASFALTATVPRHVLAVGNMPVMREEPIEPNLKKVIFAPTPKMSTYLFVLTIGELERITAEADGVTVGIVTTSGKAAKGQFALDSATKLLIWFNEYFGVKYPLPKLDLIAVPGGFAGAMENWGGITFFESRLLFDPTTNPDSARRGIFSIIAHEMAHQWFGDLVTMAWWDNLWLNEGFATWMATKAAEQFHPQWQSWLNGYGQKQFAMSLDARRTSHPIQQPVADESEAMIAFDAITYNKGQALIRMLENYLGEAAFRDGIRAYMTAHAYGNSTTADLWRALERSSHKPVTEIAASFTEQDGVPLILAETTCNGGAQQLSLRQDRFVVAPAGTPALSPRNWQIPVVVGKVGSASSDVVLLRGSTDIPAGSCGEAIKVNLGDIGYYRVAYGPASAAALATALPQMSPIDRVSFLADSWAMVQAGRAAPASYLALVENVGIDDRRPVWDQIIAAFSTFNRLSRDRPERPALQRYISNRLRPVLDRLGWDGSGADDDENSLLRSALIRTLGELGDEAVIAEAKRRFAGFLRDPNALPAALRDSVTHVVGITADRATYDTLLTLARNSSITSERVRYYFAAASARDPMLARATLTLCLGDEVPGTIVTGMINTVAFSGERPELAWEFLQQHYDALLERQGAQFRDQFIANFMTNFSDAGRAAELAGFAPAHATSGGRVMAGRAQEVIAISADLKTRVLPAAAAWIRERK